MPCIKCKQELPLEALVPGAGKNKSVAAAGWLYRRLRKCP